MTRTIKDEQVENLFNPQTVNDREAVNLLATLGRLVDEHKGNRRFTKVIGLLAGVTLALGREDGNLDVDLLQREIKKLTDEFWEGGEPSDGHSTD